VITDHYRLQDVNALDILLGLQRAILTRRVAATILRGQADLAQAGPGSPGPAITRRKK
jgi:hypothetical protein